MLIPGLLSLAYPSTASYHRINFSHIRFVIKNHPVEFHPGMREKWQVLNTDDQLGRETVLFEKAGCCRRALQAQSRFEVENRGQIDRTTDLLQCDGLLSQSTDRSVPNFLVNCRKIVSKERVFKAQKLEVR